ncbi:hypothetical protein NE237_012336 [Protea cynaroides]|uniref:Uncharacterized protein n=1 Tax=Protea cynaroides TaxID=273540 RepID=A0A9Q0GZL9_9MAGN|nr:hypothetical protein NE237_012336 [Protea cynaroides]
MNKNYIDEDERYIKFEFCGTVYSEPKPQRILDDKIRYYNKYYHSGPPFSQVQCNLNEKAVELIESRVLLSLNLPGASPLAAPASRIINESLGKDCAFTYNSYCFIGKIWCDCGDFRFNDAVENFFNQTQRGSNCFVDEMGTTFFVLSDFVDGYTNVDKTVPKFI